MPTDTVGKSKFVQLVGLHASCAAAAFDLRYLGPATSNTMFPLVCFLALISGHFVTGARTPWQTGAVHVIGKVRPD